MSSSISPSEELLANNNFSCETNSEDSSQNEETTGVLQSTSSGTTESISISSAPVFSAPIYNLCIQCSYVITALNLEIKYITKETSSLKDKLACKLGIEKSSPSEDLKQSSSFNYASTKENQEKPCNNIFHKKHQLSIKLPIQEIENSTETTLMLPMTSFSDTYRQEQTSSPLKSIVAASIYSKSSPSKKEETSSTCDSLKNKHEIGFSTTRHSISKDPQLQFIEEYEKAKIGKEEESSKEKHQEKNQEKDQKDSEQKKEKIKLINNLKKRRFFSSNTKKESLNTISQAADNFIQTKIDSLELENYDKNLLKHSLQTSLLSQIFNMRISNLDVLLLFIEVMKLSLKSRQQQHLFRSQERLLQLSHMKEIVCSFKEQANALLFSGLASGLLAVFSGVAPIFGHIKGDWALGHLSKLFSSLKDMESDKFFENVSKITLATSEMAKATGQIQTAFNESHRTHDDHFREMYKIDADDRVRSIEEIKDNWRALESFLYQCLQMQHDTIKQLYQ